MDTTAPSCAPAASASAEAWVRASATACFSASVRPWFAFDICTVTVLAAPGAPMSGGHGETLTGQAIGGTARTIPGLPMLTPEPEPEVPLGAPEPNEAPRAGAVGRAGDARDGTTAARVMASAAA